MAFDLDEYKHIATTKMEMWDTLPKWARLEMYELEINGRILRALYLTYTQSTEQAFRNHIAQVIRMTHAASARFRLNAYGIPPKTATDITFTDLFK